MLLRKHLTLKQRLHPPNLEIKSRSQKTPTFEKLPRSKKPSNFETKPRSQKPPNFETKPRSQKPLLWNEGRPPNFDTKPRSQKPPIFGTRNWSQKAPNFDTRYCIPAVIKALRGCFKHVSVAKFYEIMRSGFQVNPTTSHL